jgi:hypothetical protein
MVISKKNKVLKERLYKYYCQWSIVNGVLSMEYYINIINYDTEYFVLYYKCQKELNE